MATVARRRPTKALPQVEATMLIEGISKSIIECKARQSFTLGFITVTANEAFFLVRSERRENRYYAVKYNDGHCRYQCSCGCGFGEHQHLTMVREHVAAAEAIEVVEEPIEETVVAEESAAPVAEVADVAEEIDNKTKLEQELTRRLSLYRTYKIDGLRYRASKLGIDIKSRKRVDFINAILSSDKIMLEREYCLV